MRRLLLSMALGLVLVVTGCGGDDRPDNGAGRDGAFGQADDCRQLAEQAVSAREQVLTRLGDARRTDTERVDAALESFGGGGTDLDVRYEGLGCDGSFEDAVCRASADLTAAGPAGRDLLATWTSACSR